MNVLCAWMDFITSKLMHVYPVSLLHINALYLLIFHQNSICVLLYCNANHYLQCCKTLSKLIDMSRGMIPHPVYPVPAVSIIISVENALWRHRIYFSVCCMIRPNTVEKLYTCIQYRSRSYMYWVEQYNLYNPHSNITLTYTVYSPFNLKQSMYWSVPNSVDPTNDALIMFFSGHRSMHRSIS